MGFNPETQKKINWVTFFASARRGTDIYILNEFENIHALLQQLGIPVLKPILSTLAKKILILSTIGSSPQWVRDELNSIYGNQNSIRDAVENELRS